jgi:TRAP-type C4-dicarboxylate transport system substrate-binding protein
MPKYLVGDFMPPIHIRFGDYQPPASVHNKAAEVLGHTLATRLGASVRFELNGNIVASGHRAADLLTMVESGVRAMCYFSASYLAAQVPEFALLDLPFTINDRQKAYAVLDGALGQLLTDKLHAITGFRLLALWDNGFRHLTNAVRSIRTPMDCVGLRLRTLLSDVHQRVFQGLDFEPVALDVKELMAGVQSGAIEAQENPLTNTYHFGIHRYHRYITLSGHFFGAAVLLCHRASYAGWPTEVQRAIEEAVHNATAAQRRFAAAEDDDVLTKLRLARNEIIHLTDAERALFVAATVDLPTDPCYLATDRRGKFLLATYYEGRGMSIHPIRDDGAASDPPIERRETARGAHSIQTDPSNRFAFVPHIAGRGPNEIWQFRFDAQTGRLTPNSPPKVVPEHPLGPRHFCFHPSKAMLYYSNEQGCSVTAYRFDTSAGTLTAMQTVSTLPNG